MTLVTFAQYTSIVTAQKPKHLLAVDVAPNPVVLPVFPNKLLDADVLPNSVLPPVAPE